MAVQVSEEGHLLTEGKMPRVMLDMDGVIYDWVKCTSRLATEEFGTDYGGLIPSKEFDEWGWLDQFITQEQWAWLWTKGIGRMFGQVEDGHYQGGPKFARWLGVNTHLIICTSRPMQAAIPTSAWLAHHRIQFRTLHVVPPGEAKSTIVPDAHIYIDDKPSHVADFIDNTRGRVLVPRRGWNQGGKEGTDLPKSKRVIVYDNFKEAQEWLSHKV